MARFLTGRTGEDGLIWACIDKTLYPAPAVAERRFAAYLASFDDEAAARQALLEAGCAPQSITEEIRPKRCRPRG